MGSICTQICGENSVKRMGKTGLEISKILTPKQVTRPPFYRPEKYSRWDLSELPVDRPVDRQRSKIRPLEPPVDRSVDRNKQRAELSAAVDRPVDRTTVLPDVHKSVHVGRLHGRPDLDSVDRPVDRTGLTASSKSVHS